MKGCVPNMPEGLDTLAKGIGKAIETVPELYQDAFQLYRKQANLLLVFHMLSMQHFLDWISGF